MIVSESSTADTREVKSRYVPGPIDKLRAIEEIRQLKSRYFQVVDEKDWAGIEALFTTDARVDFGGEGQHHIGHHGVTAADINPDDWIVSGGEATARVIAGAVSEVISVHQGHDPQIELISPNRAVGRWSMYDRLEYGDEVMHGYGHYHEKYERVDGEWKFSALTLTRLRVVWSDK
ncbi:MULTISPECIES: nuclear transport factor 2 family protein [Rhodococcus]|uniref:nuclear transport factor 2 family protein n=1 Tax=Rhodococcus TaxID=1827 RepID=UPI000B005926|nr:MULTISPECIES: nuclear transport factor 2 family protein [Rhodococcus]UDG96446.1 nuclear transport factor 2 family protein [Rhodococcus opacus PD630]